MSTFRITRFLVSMASLLFAGLAVGLWVAPELAARQVGLEAVRAAGTTLIRADLGGLFAGMAVLCGAAAWTRRRTWIIAASTMLTAIIVGRVLGWVHAGRVGSDAIEMAIELGLVAGLAEFARSARSTEAPPTVARGAAVTPSAGRPPGRRAILVAGALLAVVLSGAVAALQPGMAQRVFDAAAERRASTINTAPLEDDALRVAVCGSSAPLPSAARAKACVAVFAGGKFYVVDVGPESVENLVIWGIPLSSIGGVLLTHFHSDHIGDLGELNLQTWAGGRPAPLAVYGGPGIEQVVGGFNQAYRLDQGYRTAHHNDRVMPMATWPMIPHTIALDGPETPARDRSAPVLEDGGLRITAIEVDHAPIAPAYAYRFDYKGRSVLVTGDLKFHAPLVRAADGVDVLIAEAIAPSMTRALGKGARTAGRERTAAIMHDIEDYHLTPEQAARIANEAHARLLVLYHLLPAPDGLIPRRVFAQGIDEARRGDWTFADDGSLYTLPIGSRDVRIGRVAE